MHEQSRIDDGENGQDCKQNSTRNEIEQFVPGELEFQIDRQKKTDVGGWPHEVDERYIDVVQQIDREVNLGNIAPRKIEQHTAGGKDDGVEPGLVRNIPAGEIAQHDHKAEHAAEKDTLLHKEEHGPELQDAHSASKHADPLAGIAHIIPNAERLE